MFSSKAPNAARYLGAIPQFLAATTPVAPADSHPLVDELADVAKDALNNLVRGALAGAGRALTSRAEKAGNQDQRRAYIDALHALRVSSASLQRAFAVELDRSFARPAPTDASIAAPALSPLSEDLWRGVRDQLETLSAKLSLAPVAGRFSPGRLQAVVRNSVARTELPARTAEVTRELLEQGLFSHLDQVYRRIVERLEQHSLPGLAPAFPVAANQAPVAAASTPSLHIDPLTKALLVEIAATRDPDARGRVYANAQLATELLEILKPGTLGGTPVRTRAISQRLALIGRMFGAIGAEPLLPASFKQGFERLRFPMIKSALADSSFFTQRTHSLRVIAGDLIRRAVNVYLCGADSSAPLEAMLRRWAEDFDLSAEYVRPALAGLRPLAPGVIETFLAELQDDARERAQWGADRASTVARNATEARFIGKIVPPSTLPRMATEWSQVMAHRLLEKGHGSARWHEGIRILDQLMEHALGREPGAPLEDLLRQQVAAGLHEAGLSEDLLDVAARTPNPPFIIDEPPAVEPDVAVDAGVPGQGGEAIADTAEEPPQAGPSALETLLRSARWYRVYDHRQRKTRWLRLEAFYPRQDSVAFAEIDGANPLCMRGEQFLEDLRTGRSAPTNPDPDVRRLLQHLQRNAA